MEKRMLYQSLLRLIMAETQTPHKAQSNATIEKNSKRRRKRRRWKLFFVFMRSYKFKAGWCLCVIHSVRPLVSILATIPIDIFCTLARTSSPKLCCRLSNRNSRYLKCRKLSKIKLIVRQKYSFYTFRQLASWSAERYIIKAFLFLPNFFRLLSSEGNRRWNVRLLVSIRNA